MSIFKSSKLSSLLLAVTLASGIATTPAVAAQLDATAREALVRAGEAQTFVKLPLGTMHVRVSGPADGPVVLLVHGAVIGGFAFESYRKPLADAGYRVIVPDLLGYGFSDRPEGKYNKAFYADQLQQLLDALQVRKPVHIAGASMGGAVVATYVEKYPGKVRSVALMAPAGAVQGSFVAAPLLWPVVGDVIFHFFGNMNMRSMMHKAYERPVDRERIDHWMVEQTRYSGFSAGILNTLRNFNGVPMAEAYQAIGRSGVPTLAVWGTADTVNAFEQSRTIATWVPQLKLVSLEGKGHAITGAESETVLASLLPFLRNAEQAEPKVTHRVDGDTSYGVSSLGQ